MVMATTAIEMTVAGLLRVPVPTIGSRTPVAPLLWTMTEGVWLWSAGAEAKLVVVVLVAVIGLVCVPTVADRVVNDASMTISPIASTTAMAKFRHRVNCRMGSIPSSWITQTW